jgi:serine/threonine-protein kinase RsbW
MPGGLAEGDALILQYLNNVPIDYKEINVVSDMAYRILSHIKAHNPN